MNDQQKPDLYGVEAELVRIRQHLHDLRKELSPLVTTVQVLLSSNQSDKARLTEIIIGIQKEIEGVHKKVDGLSDAVNKRVDEISDAVFGKSNEPGDSGLKGVVQNWNKWWWALWVAIIAAVATALATWIFK